jgi:hypothetical protein
MGEQFIGHFIEIFQRSVAAGEKGFNLRLQGRLFSHTVRKVLNPAAPLHIRQGGNFWEDLAFKLLNGVGTVVGEPDVSYGHLFDDRLAVIVKGDIPFFVHYLARKS